MDTAGQNQTSDSKDKRKRNLMRVLTCKGMDETVDEVFYRDKLSEFPEFDVINYANAKSRYDIWGVKRFYRAFLYDTLQSQRKTKENSPLQKMLSPVRQLSGFAAYDYILKKTGSHIFANGVRGAVFMAALQSAAVPITALIVSTCFGIPASTGCSPTPFLENFYTLVSTSLPMQLATTVPAGGLVGAFGILAIIGLERAFYSGKKLSPESIKQDIIRYVKEFNIVYDRYRDLLKTSSPGDNVSLNELNAVYMLSSSNISDAYTDASIFRPLERIHNFVCDIIGHARGAKSGLWNKLRSMYNASIKYAYSYSEDLRRPNRELRAHERDVLPAIKEALNGEISTLSIAHLCPEGVGGFTTVFPTSVIGQAVSALRRIGVVKKTRISGLLQRVYLNKERLYAAPEYDFAMAHELAHASGAFSEPFANYYALKATENLSKKFPKSGYDLFAAVSHLGFAIGALRDKIEDPGQFLSELKGLSIQLDTEQMVGVPEFIFEAFNSTFNPTYSPLPPMENLLDEGWTIESRFQRLYCGSSYVAMKLVETGLKKEIY